MLSHVSDQKNSTQGLHEANLQREDGSYINIFAVIVDLLIKIHFLRAQAVEPEGRSDFDQSLTTKADWSLADCLVGNAEIIFSSFASNRPD